MHVSSVMPKSSVNFECLITVSGCKYFVLHNQAKAFLRWTALNFVFSQLQCTVQHCTASYFTELRFIFLQRTALHSICSALQSLQSTALHFTSLQSSTAVQHHILLHWSGLVHQLGCNFKPLDTELVNFV